MVGNGNVIFDTEEKKNQLKQFMRLKPTLEDTAAFFDCSATTISDFIKTQHGVTFREFRAKHMVHTRMGLVRKAIDMAMNGNPAMMIFCLKNVCQWQEQVAPDTDDVAGERLVIKLKRA
jgi:hypothetical protein